MYDYGPTWFESSLQKYYRKGGYATPADKKLFSNNVYYLKHCQLVLVDQGVPCLIETLALVLALQYIELGRIDKEHPLVQLMIRIYPLMSEIEEQFERRDDNTTNALSEHDKKIWLGFCTALGYYRGQYEDEFGLMENYLYNNVVKFMYTTITLFYEPTRVCQTTFNELLVPQVIIIDELFTFLNHQTLTKLQEIHAKDVASGLITEESDYLFDDDPTNDKVFYLLFTIHKLYLEDVKDSPNPSRTFCIPGLNSLPKCNTYVIVCVDNHV